MYVCTRETKFFSQDSESYQPHCDSSFSLVAVYVECLTDMNLGEYIGDRHPVKAVWCHIKLLDLNLFMKKPTDDFPDLNKLKFA
jgi:hypothetical protein